MQSTQGHECRGSFDKIPEVAKGKGGGGGTKGEKKYPKKNEIPQQSKHKIDCNNKLYLGRGLRVDLGHAVRVGLFPAVTIVKQGHF